MAKMVLLMALIAMVVQSMAAPAPGLIGQAPVLGSTAENVITTFASNVVGAFGQIPVLGQPLASAINTGANALG